MKVIGITGGVGSGKSYVADIVAEEFDMLHIDTDSIARRQMMKGGASYEAVLAEFGEEILDPDKEIDRAALSAMVFQDKEKLEKLNSLTHPRVNETLDALLVAARDDFDYVLLETAILKEAGYQPLCDMIWFVHAPLEDRIKRLVESRGYSEEKSRSIISAQATEEEFSQYATHIIENPDSADRADIIKAIGKILETD